MSGAGRTLIGGSERAGLARGEVHVWEADLAEVPDSLAREVLSPDERERAGSILGAARRRTWARTRALLRLLLGGYLDCDPRPLRFVAGAHGKPALSGAQSRLRFSVSHSDASALYALALGREVGIDLQLRAPAGRLPALARRAFTVEAAVELASMQPAARRSAFMSAWARHEATLKCLGVGLAGTGAPCSEEVWTVELPLRREGGSALAVLGSPGPIRRRRWHPGDATAASGVLVAHAEAIVRERGAEGGPSALDGARRSRRGSSG